MIRKEINKNDKEWWNSLSDEWKTTLIENYNDCESNKNNQIDSNLDISENNLLKILNNERLHIPVELAIDLSPVFYLNNITDFYINPPDEVVTDFIFIYPKQLRSKVKQLIFWQPGYFYPDLNLLKDFVNLETIEFQSCLIKSLSGIEKFKKLKHLSIDQGNFYSDLTPLKNLKLRTLNVSFTEVNDLSPLSNMVSLESINLEGLTIKSIQPIINLPNLDNIYIIYTEFDDNNIIIQEIDNAIIRNASLSQNSERGNTLLELKEDLINRLKN